MSIIKYLELLQEEIPVIENPPIKQVLMNQEPVDDVLHVISVCFNPCQSKRRIQLMNEFIERMAMEEDDRQVVLYIVEVVYGPPDTAFAVTQAGNPRHYQIRLPEDEPVLWLKESLINVAVRELLPSEWKAMAWLDADLAFENLFWATECLQLLNGAYDVVQLFSHCVDMDREEGAMQIHTSLGYQHVKGLPPFGKGLNYGHPGYAWACSRSAYEQMGGLYEFGVLGSGDNIMALSFIQSSVVPISFSSHPEYLKSVADFKRRVRGFRFGYVSGVIRHYYHGSKANYKYTERWKILVRGGYNPSLHVWSDMEKGGVLRASTEFPAAMAEEIREYFFSRKEDD
jgi:hypothetical protein